METAFKLAKCAVLTCPNEADPRWFARDVNDHPVMICDGHVPMPKPSEVAVRPPDPTALDLAARIVRNGYAPRPSEVERVAHALLAEQEELSELRDIADLVSDADISALPPELLAVKQRWLAARHAKEVAEAETALAAMGCQQRFPSTITATQLVVMERTWLGLPKPDAKCSLKLGHSGPHMCEQPLLLEQP